MTLWPGNLRSDQLHFGHLLLLVAVTALDDAMFFVHNIEDSVHRLVVGDAFGIIAFHNSPQLIRSLDGLLLYNLIVADNVEHYLGSHDTQPVDFILREELV